MDTDGHRWTQMKIDECISRVYLCLSVFTCLQYMVYLCLRVYLWLNNFGFDTDEHRWTQMNIDECISRVYLCLSVVKQYVRSQ